MTGGRRGLWLLLALFAVLWFSNLEYRKLIKPDEGRYAEIPREMVESGDWVTPRLNGLKYFEKPPLQYWATAATYEVFGDHHWTSRLWNALTGFLCVLLVWFGGARLFGTEAGRYAALILASSLLFALMGHVNTLDIGVTFFVTLGIVSLLLAQHSAQMQARWMWLAWAALGLAVLSKGLMGLVLPGAALVIYSLVQRDFAFWRRMHWVSGLLILLAVTVPWFYLVIKANPEFYHFFFIHEHWERFTTKVHERYQPWYYFVPVLLFGMLPWTLLMFSTAWRAWKSGATELRAFSPVRFLFVWAVFVYVFFSISSSKLPAYLLPMFPALALLMGREVAQMTERRLAWLIAPVLVPVAAGLWFAISSDRFADTPVQQEMYRAYAAWIIAALLVLAAGVAAAIFWLRARRKMTAMLVLAIAALITSLLVTSGYNNIARERSAYELADAIRPMIRPEVPFYSVEMYEQTLPFYLKRTMILVAFQDEMAFGIGQEPQRWIPDFASFAEVWSKQKEAYAIMPGYAIAQLEPYKIPMNIIYQDHQYVVVSKP